MYTLSEEHFTDAKLNKVENYLVHKFSFGINHLSGLFN